MKILVSEQPYLGYNFSPRDREVDVGGVRL